MSHDCYMFELTSKTVTTSEAIPTVIIIIIINIDTTWLSLIDYAMNIIIASIIVLCTHTHCSLTAGIIIVF